MLSALDDAMTRIFCKHQTKEERLARLEQHEDEFLARKDDDEPALCAYCMGSGEGQYDGTRCHVCNGRRGDNTK